MTPSIPEYLCVAKPTSGKTVGYIRVSTITQNVERQLDGVSLDKVFIEHASGKDTNRPQLQAVLEYLREGDVLLVHSIDRLARNLMDLRRIVSDLTARGVCVEFRKENIVFDGKEAALSTFLLNMLGGFAEFERALSHERILEGVAIAKKAGKYKGRAPAIRSSNGKLDLLEKLYTEGTRVAEMARQAKVSRQTVYSWLKSRPKSVEDCCKPIESVIPFRQRSTA